MKARFVKPFTRINKPSNTTLRNRYKAMTVVIKMADIRCKLAEDIVAHSKKREKTYQEVVEKLQRRYSDNMALQDDRVDAYKDLLERIEIISNRWRAIAIGLFIYLLIMTVFTFIK